MALPKIFKQGFIMHQKPLIECVRTLKSLQLVRRSSFSETVEPVLETPETKLLKVAIMGRPNVGKSTLINSILNLNLCGASQKSHTTQTYFKAAFTRGDTQIVFVDTPGLVTHQEIQRFELSDKFINWKEEVLNEADIIGIVHEILDPKDVHKLHLNLVQNIHSIPESKEVFMVINKIDLVIDKAAFAAVMEDVMKPLDLNRPSLRTKSKVWRRISRIFFTSATRNKGVEEIVDYLTAQAKPGKWIFEPGESHKKPLNVLVTELLRAQLLNILPHQIPYECKYQVEYLKKNHLGEFICVALIRCNPKDFKFIITKRKTSLREISKTLESDLFKILHKVFRIRIVVVNNLNKRRRID